MKKEGDPSSNKKSGRGEQSTSAMEQVVETFESEEEQFTTPAKKGKKQQKKYTKPAAIAMDLEVPAADTNTPATVEVTSLLDTDIETHLPFSDPSTKYKTKYHPKPLKVRKLLGLDRTIAQSTQLKQTQLKRPDLNGLWYMMHLSIPKLTS